MKFKWLLIWVVILGLTSHRVVSDTLELVQVVFRHGDRSPTDPFPNDVNNDYWLQTTDGFGMLSNIGKQQQKELGQYLRQRYGGILNASYDHNEIVINSTDVDRTLMSAYSHLAGLYPPSGQQVWNPAIAWQPIPVHTREENADYILSAAPNCPKYNYLFDQEKQSPEVVAIDLENKYLYDYVTNQTGYSVTDMFSLNHVTDALYCDQCHGLPWPSWVPPLWDKMYSLHHLKFFYEFAVPELARLKGGTLLGSLINNMQWKAKGLLGGRKVNLLSSHDSKVAAFLGSLGVYNNITPPYASAVIFELIKDVNSAYGVQIFYRNDTSVQPFPLTIPNCSFNCPLDKFINLTASMVPDDIVAECNLIPPPPAATVVDKLSDIWKSIVG